jgi:Protein of unknown function (DUF4079)
LALRTGEKEENRNIMNLTEALEPIAAFFRGVTPEPIVHWGHPFFMGIVVVFMGSFAAISGWRGRTLEDKDAAMKNLGDHRKIAPLMFLFMAMGYTGGVLSLVIQRQPILESSHFWTGSLVLILLGLNGAISLSGFFGNKSTLRTYHAYLGSVAIVALVAHALLGLQLGLSL